jgi:phytoene desaturase (3,4-didehydrolycopene-forming)
LLPFLPEINPLDLLGQHDWRLRQFFKDPRLRAMFTFQASCPASGRFALQGAHKLHRKVRFAAAAAMLTSRAAPVTGPLQDLYVGLTPYSAPAVFGLLAGTELTDGVWYPLGGFQTVGGWGGNAGICSSCHSSTAASAMWLTWLGRWGAGRLCCADCRAC